MDTNTPLHLVVVVLTKLHATGETPGFKKAAQTQRPALLMQVKQQHLTRKAERWDWHYCRQGRKVSFPLKCITEVTLTSAAAASTSLACSHFKTGSRTFATSDTI